MELGAALTDDDVAGNDGFATELLDAEATARGVAAVAGRSACLFMSHVSNSSETRRSGAGDVGDAQNGQLLAMTLLTAIILPALLLEDDDLVGTSLFEHGRGDGGAGHDGRANLVTDHQNLIERDGLAGFTRELFDADDVVGGNLILLAAGLDDCEHDSLPFIQTKPDAALQVTRSAARGRKYIDARSGVKIICNPMAPSAAPSD